MVSANTVVYANVLFFFFSSRRRHTRCLSDWSSDVCSSDLRSSSTYYDFVSVDDDRYVVDGRYRQVMLSPRELNSASLPTRTFINERLTFTQDRKSVV